jgi:hypothetical protein
VQQEIRKRKKEFLKMEYGIQQGYNPLTSAAYASQPYAPQSGQASPFGGVIGSGIGGLFGGQNIGRQPGQGIDGIGGMFQNYGNLDPMTAAHIQQAQLAQQMQLAQQQQQLAQLVQQAQVAQQLAQQQQVGRLSPFGVDPISVAIAQQRAQAGLAGGIGVNPFTNPLNVNPFNFNPLNRIDPITAAYIQQAQVAQLCQQLGQQGQFGQQLGYGHHGQGQFGQAWLGAGQNLWANPQLATQFGRNLPLGYGLGAGGFGGQLPAY